MGANQKAIAERLGVSLSTVSRALRNDPAVSDGTRARIIEAAAAVGYHLPPNSRVGAGQATEPLFVGMFFQDDRSELDDTPSSFPTSYLAGINRMARAENLAVVTHSLPAGDADSILDARRQPSLMAEGRLAGAILVHRWPEDAVRRLAVVMPCVTVTHYVPGARADHVSSDHLGGVAMLVERLAALGHRRIGFVAGRERTYYASARHAAYVLELSRRGMELDPSWALNVRRPELDWDDQAKVVKGLARKGVRAWICANDHAGYQLHARLVRAGVRVPGDVSIAGFDGDPPPPGCPRLTTVRARFEEIGAAALELLVRRIRGAGGPFRQILIGCDLEEGETSGPPPG